MIGRCGRLNALVNVHPQFLCRRLFDLSRDDTDDKCRLPGEKFVKPNGDLFLGLKKDLSSSALSSTVKLYLSEKCP